MTIANHLFCLCSHQGVGKFRAALHALLIPPRPPKPTPTPAGPTAPAPPDDEPQFLGADDLGSLALAMMNNLSISSPLADLQDVGPSWSNPAEAPFYNPKPQKPPIAGQVDHPPGGERGLDALKSARQALHGAPVVVQDPLLQALQQPSPPLGAPVTGASPLTMSPFSAASSQAQAQTATYHPAAAVPMAPRAWDAFVSLSPPPAHTISEDAARAMFDFTPFFSESAAPVGLQRLPADIAAPVTGTLLPDSDGPSWHSSTGSGSLRSDSASEPSPFAMPMRMPRPPSGPHGATGAPNSCVSSFAIS